MPTQAKRIIVLFLVVGVLLLALGLFKANQALRLQRDGISVPGRVVSLVRGSKGSRYPVVEFRARDGEIIAVKSSMSSSAYRVGETVAILYDPADPQHASIQSFGQMWGASLTIGLMGFVFAAIPGGSMLVAARRSRQIEYLQRYGQRVATKFARVERANFRVNNRFAYRIFSQGQNPFTSEVQEFRSDYIWFDPAGCIGERPIDVLIDPANSRKYWLDTGFLPPDKN